MKFYSNVNEISKEFLKLYGAKNFTQFERYKNLMRNFCKYYQKNGCYFASSSGRVELVGNHLDHEGGNVLSCAISLDILCAFLPNDSNKIVINSDNRDTIEIDLRTIEKKERNSRGLVKGVANYFVQNSCKIGGVDAYISSIIPTGAGISSSAAFELLFAQIFNELFNNGELSQTFIAKSGQYAENEYFLKPCGLLDQMTVASGGVVCLNFENEPICKRVENNLNDFSLVVINAGGSHSKLTEHYAKITQEMKSVSMFFGKTRLCQVNEKDFWANRKVIEQKISKRAVLRAEHYFEENARVLEAIECFKTKNGERFLQLLKESGKSSLEKLQNCFVEGATEKPIVDVIERALEIEKSAGVRVHGGGFAGTVLCVVPLEKSKRFVKEMQKVYGKNQVLCLKTRNVGVTVL